MTQNTLQTSTGTIYDLTELGLLKVSGEQEANKFLQGQLTCNVDEITKRDSRMGAHCNPQGRVISLFHLLQINVDYYLLLPRNMITITLAALKKYAVFYKTVALTDVSEQYTILGYVPDKERGLVSDKWTSVLLPSPIRRQIIINDTQQMEAFCKNFTDFEHGAVQQWKQLDIKESIPSIYPETSGTFLPHEINLPELNAVNFEKGCYTGQEIIARMHYRGKLKNHLYKATITSTSPLTPGATIYSKRNEEPHACGTLVDSCPNTDNHYQVLLVTDEANAKNQHLFATNDGNYFIIDGM